MKHLPQVCLVRMFYHSHRMQVECQAQPQMAEGGARRKCQQQRLRPCEPKDTCVTSRVVVQESLCCVHTPVISAPRSPSRRTAVSQGQLRLHSELKTSRRYVVKLWQIHSKMKWEALLIGFWKCKEKYFVVVGTLYTGEMKSFASQNTKFTNTELISLAG